MCLEINGRAGWWPRASMARMFPSTNAIISAASIPCAAMRTAAFAVTRNPLSKSDPNAPFYKEPVGGDTYWFGLS